MDELREHPQVAELIDTLDKNDMHKEKAEVESLVDYIGEMEKTLSEMLKEMQNMRKEISLIHNSTLRSKCQNLVQKTEGKIKQIFAVIGKIKDNFIQAVGNAVRTFKEKGKEAFKKAVRAMKVPETFDNLSGLFGKFSKDIEQDVAQIDSMQTELTGAKNHLKNVGRLLVGKPAKEAEQEKSDKGILSRLGKVFGKIGRGFETLSQKAMDKADKIRAADVKESVRNELDALKGIKGAPGKSDPIRDR
ncbi:MAG: hypothetical protein IJK65_02120 [Clostridiales bacterium]|nr:hypothetical protein [Clostridiales bacterium]